MHERDEIGVVEEVAELGLDVAVVDVDRDGPDLPRREHRLDPLGAVVGVDPHVIADPDPTGREVVGQPSRAFVELAVGEAAVVGDDGLTVRGDIGDGFEQVCEVPLLRHGRSP